MAKAVFNEWPPSRIGQARVEFIALGEKASLEFDANGLRRYVERKIAMPHLPVRFETETVSQEGGGSYDRDIILTTLPDGSVASRVATVEDRAEYPAEYAAFVNPQVVPSHDELMAEWQAKNPPPTAAQTAEVIAKRDAAAAGAAAAETPAAKPAPAAAPSKA
jgi:hypothetical protein